MKIFGYKVEALIILKRIPEALEFSTKYQNLFIDNPEFLYWRGKVLIYNGNLDMGKKFIREALNKDPDNVNF
jgi:tetratricopeptide (TPR) repeat protein